MPYLNPLSTSITTIRQDYREPMIPGGSNNNSPILQPSPPPPSESQYGYRQEYEEQPLPPPPNIYQPMGNPQPADVIKYRLESEDLMQQLEHDLKGEAFINGIWKPSYGRWINNEGLSIVLSCAGRYANRGAYLAKLNSAQIGYKCSALKKELARLFFKKAAKYDIDPAKRSLLIRKIVDTVHLSLTRSEEGHESKSISETAGRQEIIHRNEPINQGGTGIKLPFISR